MELSSIYFYGNEVSDYAKEHGYLDYGTLAKAFDAVLNNDIMSQTDGICGYWEQISGFVNNTDEIEKLKNEIDELEQLITAESAEDQDEETNAKIEELESEIEELENEEQNIPEVYQWYIVSSNGAEILEDCNEIVYYSETLDMYLWGVTHWGTGWDYVLTNVKINCKKEN